MRTSSWLPSEPAMAKELALLELAQRGAADAFTAAWRASGLGIDCAEVTTGRPRPRSGRAWP